AHLSQLPALHPPHDDGRALAVRAARRPYTAGASVEALRRVLRRVAARRSGALRPVTKASRYTRRYRGLDKADIRAQRTAGIVADVGDNRRQIGIRDAEPAGERRRILIDRQRRDEPALADVIGAAVSQRRIDTVIPAAPDGAAEREVHAAPGVVGAIVV